MNRIDARFRQLAEQESKAFIPYITAGDPSLDRTRDLVLELERAGADIVELGVPFSDPIADGIVNQEAAQRALRKGVTLHDVVTLVGQLRRETELPIVLFTYFNPVLAYGYEDFATDCAAAGVDGVLCVDLPPEEAGDYKAQMDAHEVATIFLLAPTSTEDRIEAVARQSTGFVYYVSRRGVTGMQQSIDTGVHGMVDAIKRHTDTPVAVGFGVSTPEQAKEIAGYADGVIVGSAIVRMVGELGDTDEMPLTVGAFVKTLADGAKGLR